MISWCSLCRNDLLCSFIYLCNLRGLYNIKLWNLHHRWTYLAKVKSWVYLLDTLKAFYCKFPFQMFYWANSVLSLSVHSWLPFLLFSSVFPPSPSLLCFLLHVTAAVCVSSALQDEAARFRLPYVWMRRCIWPARIPAAARWMFGPPHSAYSGLCSRPCGELVSVCVWVRAS